MMMDNFTQTFQLEQSNLRGRIVRLGSVLDDILTPHDYPLPVLHLTAETVALTLALSAMLKYEGIFTLQAQGDGPVGMLVADATSAGIVRGCASFNRDRLQHSREQVAALKTTESAQNHLAQYLGKGHLAFTVDQGQHTERYQGIVELKGSSLVDCVQHYFNQSEQIGTGIKMAVGKRGDQWRTCAIMLQNMPEDQANVMAGLTNEGEDDWRRSMILLDSCTDDELLDENLDAQSLLFRLFHEEGVRVYDPQDVKKGCRCSEERVHNILMTMSDDDLEDMVVDGKITMTCEFCSTHYVFDPKKVAQDIKNATKNKDN